MESKNISAPRNLVVATGNPGKVREIRGLLADLPFEVLGLSDFDNIREIDETGATFTENAILKARGYAEQTGALTLADDSGLEVDVLGKAPGVFSARYGGKNTSYEHKIEKLLGEIELAGDTDRRARFVCSMALADERGGVLHVSEGVCEGQIALAPRGGNGFGYDPVFIPDGFTATFGELPDEMKQQISHRSRAVSGIIRYLLEFNAV